MVIKAKFRFKIISIKANDRNIYEFLIIYKTKRT